MHSRTAASAAWVSRACFNLAATSGCSRSFFSSCFRSSSDIAKSSTWSLHTHPPTGKRNFRAACLRPISTPAPSIGRCARVTLRWASAISETRAQALRSSAETALEVRTDPTRAENGLLEVTGRIIRIYYVYFVCVVLSLLEGDHQPCSTNLSHCQSLKKFRFENSIGCSSLDHPLWSGPMGSSLNCRVLFSGCSRTSYATCSWAGRLS